VTKGDGTPRHTESLPPRRIDIAINQGWSSVSDKDEPPREIVDWFHEVESLPAVDAWESVASKEVCLGFCYAASAAAHPLTTADINFFVFPKVGSRTSLT
jgi:hypothetical protein